MTKRTISKRIGALLTGTAIVLSLAACGGNPDVQQGTGGGSGGKEPYKIGVIQSIEHASLTAAYDGFRAALTDNGYVEGVDVLYDYQNAQSDTSTLATIADRFAGSDIQLVLAITTDAAQVAANKITNIPILATAVTSYTETGILEDETHPGINLSGTSDMNPVAAQIELIKELVPDVKTIGLIYNGGEDNSTLQIRLAKEKIAELGLEYAEVTVTNSGEVLQAMKALVQKCDAVYIPTDNVVASAMATVHSVAMESGTPTVCGAADMVLEGGLATMGISYYELGYKTGLMAIEVMNGKDVAEMPIQYADRSDEVTINGTVAKEIGFQVPEKYLASVVE